MCVLGFGWCGLHTTCPYKGTLKLPESLAVHFKTIIKEETSRRIPNKLPTNLSSRKHVPTLESLSKHVIAMDCSRSENDREFEYSARKFYMIEISMDLVINTWR